MMTHKYQVIDDDSLFKDEIVEKLTADLAAFATKQYQVVSVIGSQSSGKSTLMNSLFNSKFDVLKRKEKGQTTRGIWLFSDKRLSTLVLDVEGSDSNERDERTKIENRNSLFALALSHTLLINLWVHQVGLYKGSQLSILEIILELNLKLFGSQKPKSIIFVVRDFGEDENEQTIKKQLFSKVSEVWKGMPKPAGKQRIQLTDLFHLNAFFMPSKLEEPELFNKEVEKLKQFIKANARNQEITHQNVPIQDLPKYMQKLWAIIETDKDINLPQEKIMLSNLRCHQLKRVAFEKHSKELRGELEQAERKICKKLGSSLKVIATNIFKEYDLLTKDYIQEQASKVRLELVEEVEAKIESNFRCQSHFVSEEFLNNFIHEIEKSLLKDKNVDSLKKIEDNILKSHAECLASVSYKEEWVAPLKEQFVQQLQSKFEHIKDKIVENSINQFNNNIKKSIDASVSMAFYDRKIFFKDFWGYIGKTLKQVEHSSKNSIVNLFEKLRQKESGKAKMNAHIQTTMDNVRKQLRTAVEMKCNDLVYYVMRHFGAEFNMQENDVPRHWNQMKIEEIEGIYNQIRDNYLLILDEFSSWKDAPSQTKDAPQRFSCSLINLTEAQELIKSKDMMALKKDLAAKMKKELEEAITKHKQVYSSSIPLWGWILMIVVAVDDILIWLSSPMLAIPVTLLLIIIGLVFALGGKNVAKQLVGNAQGALKGMIQSATAQAATKILKRQ